MQQFYDNLFFDEIGVSYRYSPANIKTVDDYLIKCIKLVKEDIKLLDCFKEKMFERIKDKLIRSIDRKVIKYPARINYFDSIHYVFHNAYVKSEKKSDPNTAATIMVCAFLPYVWKSMNIEPNDEINLNSVEEFKYQWTLWETHRIWKKGQSILPYDDDDDEPDNIVVRAEDIDEAIMQYAFDEADETLGKDDDKQYLAKAYYSVMHQVNNYLPQSPYIHAKEIRALYYSLNNLSEILITLKENDKEKRYLKVWKDIAENKNLVESINNVYGDLKNIPIYIRKSDGNIKYPDRPKLIVPSSKEIPNYKKEYKIQLKDKSVHKIEGIGFTFFTNKGKTYSFKDIENVLDQ